MLPVDLHEAVEGLDNSIRRKLYVSPVRWFLFKIFFPDVLRFLARIYHEESKANEQAIKAYWKRAQVSGKDWAKK